MRFARGRRLTTVVSRTCEAARVAREGGGDAERKSAAIFVERGSIKFHGKIEAGELRRTYCLHVVSFDGATFRWIFSAWTSTRA